MPLPDIQFPDDLEHQIERLGCGDTHAVFALAESRFLRIKAKAVDKAARRGIKKLIHPDNARKIIPHLPGPGERTHCALRGDFVLCDLIPAIISEHGRCPNLLMATLGLSAANADALGILRSRDRIGALTIIASHYFAKVDKATTFREVSARLRGLADLIITRCHAKIICLPTESGHHFVIEGSANARSSDNTEQIVIFNDRDLDAWHRSWLLSLPQHG